MTSQTVTAITNFAMAFEMAFFAGMLFRTAAAAGSALRWWSWAMLTLGLAALAGGIDHGFVEPEGTKGLVTPLTRPTWLLMGLMTFFTLMATVAQFTRGRAYRLMTGIAGLQLLLFVVALPWSDSFLLVLLNYAPVVLLMLVLSVIHLRSGRGSWPMVAGIIFLMAASVLQAMGVDAFEPVDRNGLYHLLSMVGIPFLYVGGLRLDRLLPTTRAEIYPAPGASLPSGA